MGWCEVHSISKRSRFHSENTSNVFPPHYADEILKRNNDHKPSWICVWGKLGKGNHMIRLDMIIVISLFSICFIFKMFAVQKKTKSRCFQFLWFEERYQNAPFSSRIGVDGSPSRRNKVLQHSVKRPKTVNRIWCISSLGKASTWKLIKICSVNRKGK